MSSDYLSGSSEYLPASPSEQVAPAVPLLQQATDLYTRLYPYIQLEDANVLSAGVLSTLTDYSLKNIDVHDREHIQHVFTQHFSAESEVIASIESVVQKIRDLKEKLHMVSKEFYSPSVDLFQKFHYGQNSPMFECDYYLCQGRYAEDNFFWDSVNNLATNSYDFLQHNVTDLLEQMNRQCWEADEMETKLECEELKDKLQYRSYSNGIVVADFTDIKTDIHNLLISGLGELIARESVTP